MHRKDLSGRVGIILHVGMLWGARSVVAILRRSASSHRLQGQYKKRSKCSRRRLHPQNGHGARRPDASGSGTGGSGCPHRVKLGYSMKAPGTQTPTATLRGGRLHDLLCTCKQALVRPTPSWLWRGDQRSSQRQSRPIFQLLRHKKDHPLPPDTLPTAREHGHSLNHAQHYAEA
jgi:hypothetical protein